MCEIYILYFNLLLILDHCVGYAPQPINHEIPGPPPVRPEFIGGHMRPPAPVLFNNPNHQHHENERNYIINALEPRPHDNNPRQVFPAKNIGNRQDQFRMPETHGHVDIQNYSFMGPEQKPNKVHEDPAQVNVVRSADVPNIRVVPVKYNKNNTSDSNITQTTTSSSVKTKTVDGVEITLDHRDAFDGDKCPSGKVRVQGVCVHSD